MAYFNTKQSVGSFTASFTYRDDPSVQSNVGQADGVTLVLQNDPRNLAAIGGVGAGLGYGVDAPVASSASVQLYLRQGAAGAIEYETAGTIDFANATPTGTVDLVNGDRIQATVIYNGTTLTTTLKDLDNPASTFTYSVAANIVAAVGGSTAYVGFTGGTGGGFSTQTISNFTFVNTIPEPASLAAFALAGVSLARRRR